MAIEENKEAVEKAKAAMTGLSSKIFERSGGGVGAAEGLTDGSTRHSSNDSPPGAACCSTTKAEILMRRAMAKAFVSCVHWAEAAELRR